MKGYRFYLEYASPAHKRKGEDMGSVLALIPENRWISNNKWLIECIAATFGHPNSQVCSGSCCYEYLATQCKRISERKAREIHPALFEYLDREEQYE